MPSPALIDISSLLTPIEGEISVGNDPRLDTAYSSDYSQIKDARRAARDAERNNMFDGDNTEANEHWGKIYSLAPKFIATQAKDIEIACWLTEALVRKSGFQGLRDGFTLIRQLIETYWEQGLYPVEDEDGIETRVAPIAGLNGEGADGVILTPIRNSFITEDAASEPYSFWQYQQAVDVSRMSDEHKQQNQIERNGFSMDNIEKAVGQSSNEYYADLYDDIEICIIEYKAVDALLIELCGRSEAPPTSKIIELLEGAKGAINHIAKAKLPIISEISDDSDSDTEELDAQVSNAKPAQGNAITAALNSRDDAFKQLNVIADYFKKTEPHSPISFMLTKTVRWGNMPLEELMKELIPDSSSRDTYSSLTGVSVDDD
ncbi:type VI secretion system protein TssA [Colwellia psychrerythraea]|uniref:Type VI secretion-associated protein, ImpA family n=1 Tax=Colwellia psychrerythraea TaxID=28229 RepID=A0A099KVN7_COLPS|nr:type VI secretion system protein TssA [Colwellia psychrerythraea]KGJ94814.1 type VI secretion-associated protein, ImpA family [Colwellia psychrerythraea]